jgi:DNA-binding SARP family transcriptional activator/tetratricopeptide (TPR) repeat protein
VLGEFRLLGDLQVVDNGRPVDIRRRQLRAVLAALLVDVNKAVSWEVLAERTWGDRQPQHPRESVYSYLSRLRTVLAGVVDIAQRNGGYVLSADPDNIDLHQFRRLVGDASEARDDDQAATLLGQALGLWRGEAFGDIETPWFASLRQTLSGERLGAQLDLADIRLRTGHHADLITGLSGLAEEHPLNERLGAQLILALCRGGRQAEALGVYERLRRLLADELGADPNPALRQLHQQILTGDSTVAPAISRNERRAAVPRQLPPGVTRFVGRTSYLAALDRLLARHHRAGLDPSLTVIAIHGPGGIGKTSLALRWAHRVSGTFPDGQLYLDLRGYGPGEPVSPVAGVGALLRAAGLPTERIPTELAERSALLRTTLAGRRALILLDNVRDAEQVRPLLPGPGSLVLVTSRNELRGLAVRDGAERLSLAEMSSAEAVDVVTGVIGAGRVGSEPAMVGELVELCGRMPLALAVAAQRAARYPDASVGDLVAELRAGRDRLRTLADPNDPAADPGAVFSWSYRALPREAARAFRYLGLHPGPEISGAAAAALLGMSPEPTRRVVDLLVSVHLLEHNQRDRYRFHDLLRVYAAERAEAEESEADRRAVVARILDWYLASAHRAALLTYPNRHPIALATSTHGVSPVDLTTGEDAQGWLDTECSVLLNAVRLAAEHEYGTHAWQLAWSLADFLDRQGYWYDHLAVQRVALAAAQREDDRLGQAQAHGGLARVSARFGRHDDATIHIGRAIDLYDQVGDRVAEAIAHRNLAWMLELRKSYPEALAHAEQALALMRTTGSRNGLGLTLNGVGYLHSLVGNYVQAIQYSEEALAVALETDDVRGVVTAWDNIGLGHHHLGHYPEAIHCYQRAIEINEGSSRYEQADVLLHLGETQHAVGDSDAAHRTWRTSLDIVDELGLRADDHLRAKIKSSLLACCRIGSSMVAADSS